MQRPMCVWLVVRGTSFNFSLSSTATVWSAPRYSYGSASARTRRFGAAVGSRTTNGPGLQPPCWGLRLQTHRPLYLDPHCRRPSRDSAVIHCEILFTVVHEQYRCRGIARRQIWSIFKECERHDCPDTPFKFLTVVSDQPADLMDRGRPWNWCADAVDAAGRCHVPF